MLPRKKQSTEVEQRRKENERTKRTKRTKRKN